MTNALLTMPRNVSLPLAQRVAGGATIWLFGRAILGGLFLISGLEKLMDIDRFASGLGQHGIPESIAPWLAPLAATVEATGGFLILIGFMTNWASLLMLAFVIIAALVSHRFWEYSDQMAATQKAHFMKNVMIAATFCLLHVAGGGPYSLDRWLRPRGA